MALLTATSVSQTATAVTAGSVSTSDTIAQADIGTRGVLLQVINGSAGSIDVTLVDPGRTPAGNTTTAPAQAVGAGEDRWFRVGPNHVNPATGVATVTFSASASVTYKLIRL